MEAGTQETTRAGPIAAYHDEEAWLEERKKHLTASDIAAIFGDHPFKTAQQVQDEKLGLVEARSPTPAMIGGLKLEPLAVELYEEVTGRRTRRIPMLVHRDHPLFAASIDRQILAGPDNPTAGLEITCPLWRRVSQIRREGLPKYKIYQGQLEAEVADYPFTGFGIFDRQAWQVLTFDLERDPTFCGDMMDRAEEWWRRHIIDREPVDEIEPPEKLPEVSGEITFREDRPFIEAIQLVLDARDIRQEATEAEKDAKEALKALLREYGVFEGGGNRCYYRMLAGRKSKDWDGLARVRPIDGAKMQHALVRELVEFPGVEEQDVLLLLQKIGDKILLDLDDFVKEGKGYEELRPYRLKVEEL